jgi:hypothetical protein
VGKGHDNELFVLLADLLDLSGFEVGHEHVRPVNVPSGGEAIAHSSPERERGEGTRAPAQAGDDKMQDVQPERADDADPLEPLMRAVKVALARHHRVMVICPWPPDVPPPGNRTVDETLAWPSTAGPEQRSSDIFRSVWERSTITRYHRAFRELRQRFGRVGVPVICAQEGAPPRLILERLELLRGLGRRP